MSSTALNRGMTPQSIISLPGVYRPQADTRLLAYALAQEELSPSTELLEIGTGTGALALSAAARGARVTAVDVSWRAVATARLNALHRRLPLRVLHGDFATRTRGRRFDMLLTNPPYVPSPEPGLPSRGPQRAWDAGTDGRRVIDRICADAPALLRPGGILLMVHSGLCGAQETVGRLEREGLTAQVTARASVPWGPVLRSRRAWLQGRGLAEEGAELEELVIIRAQHL
ncbi:HemK2/MTQ2 family protein methyltransferase [Streptomyces antarcticus]|uniref:HemK2/MTQ2 family protein methyltransferase n=1 Tax=Streptomyces antarcticus TaxID=2996458 RepID=UPI00226EF2C8|nr:MULTISPECIES: HemK2/MTQ2 family protein methyltransferase [unclassified Streptomyces]MCY0943017.1 methyltransferase [Streptomyces sp. H34-AA3]MCY0949803.1 methyltransferase [Streptomyces sp. H27-S2]MCZ4086323.1 methyltransferase [Streptomyces sp. H34-S5]